MSLENMAEGKSTDATPKANETWATNVRPHKGSSVLIVEDDVSMEPLWSYIIDEVDPHAEMRWVTTEEAAEKMIRQRLEMGQPYDLIVSDIFLSGRRTGIDLWRRYGEGATAFILMSVIGPEKLMRMTGLHEPLPPYIQKPLNPTECIDRVRNLLKSDE